MSRIQRTFGAFVCVIAITSVGCGPSGTWGEISWAPGNTTFGVSDIHTITSVGGRLRAINRVDAVASLSILMTEARAGDEEEWRRYPSNEQTTLRNELATGSTLFLDSIPMDDLEAGATWETQFSEGEQSSAIVRVDPSLVSDSTSALGDDIRVSVTVDNADYIAGGFVAGTIEVERSRGEDQEGVVSAGVITIPFSLPLISERLGKANLGIARPILQCAARWGGTGGCANEPSEPVVDAADGISGL